MIKKLMLVAALVMAPVAMGQTVQAQQGNQDKVTICHRTNSATNPYVRITVDRSAVDGVAGNSGNEADHFGEHKGPLASSEAVAQQLKDSKTEWGDIIPPVEGAHGGLNWTAEGQAIYNNNCNYAQPSTPQTPGTTLGTNTTRGAETPAGGAVTAGFGGGAGSITGSLIGLGGSLAALGFGIRRLRKSE